MEEQKPLELRMYFFVPFMLTDIAKGIQAGHAALRYAKNFSANNPIVWDFVDNHETWIILDGGTTNDQRDLNGISQGTLNQIGDELHKNGIDFTFFHEPNINNALTAICFICDERVYNKKDYPDFIEYILDFKMYPEAKTQLLKNGYSILKSQTLEKNQEMFPEYYKEWVRFVGGVKNVFLRDLLKDKKLA